MNLRARVAISGAVAVVAALTLVGAIEYPAVEHGLRADLDAQLSSAPTSDQDLKGALVKLEGAKVENITIPSGSRLLDILLVPAAGAFDKLAPITARDVAVGNGTAAPYFEDVQVGDGTLYRVYVAPLTLKDYPGAVSRIAEPESDRTRTLHQFGWLLAALIPAAGLATALGARVLAARVLSPVARLTSAVEHVTATGDLSTPIEVRGRDEVARLGLAFNAMTSALDGSVGAQRRLVADASHELRTPLTSMVTNLELLAERPDDPQAPRLIDEALWQARELTVLTNGLVDLARYGEAPARDELVYLDQLCTELAERRGAQLMLGRGPEPEPGRTPGPGPGWAAGAGWASGTPMTVRGDPAALERAVANLVDNALKFGTVALIAVRPAAGAVIIEVCDDGPGIPDADLPYVFDRFHRSEAARALPGSGLGLAIVKQIVEAHHGVVEAVPQPRGALLRITLPAAAAP
ncbi:HAMP domain-containing sensor histidine kinase [Catenulispora subtropica]|uniref:histidine kinase n=1 Tax=Catenulispora subtropica TaxID=450798 RepID=A0ABP5E8M9_9ACTN